MKLLRYGPAGQEKPGLLDRDGKIRDLSGAVRDIDGEALLPSCPHLKTLVFPELQFAYPFRIIKSRLISTTV
jgi:hypothetical protein